MVNRFERAHTHSMARLGSICNERTAEWASCAQHMHDMHDERERVKKWTQLGKSQPPECFAWRLICYVLYAIVNCHQNINLLSGDAFFHMDFLYTPEIIVKGNFICDLFLLEKNHGNTFRNNAKWSLHDDEETSSETHRNKFFRSKGIRHILYGSFILVYDSEAFIPSWNMFIGNNRFKCHPIKP